MDIKTEVETLKGEIVGTLIPLFDRSKRENVNLNDQESSDDAKRTNDLTVGFEAVTRLIEKHISQFSVMVRDCPDDCLQGFSIVKSTLSKFCMIAVNIIYSESICDYVIEQLSQSAVVLLFSVVTLLGFLSGLYSKKSELSPSDLPQYVAIICENCEHLRSLPLSTVSAASQIVSKHSTIVLDANREVEEIELVEEEKEETPKTKKDQGEGEEEDEDEDEDDLFFGGSGGLLAEQLECRQFVINLGKALVLLSRNATKIIKIIPLPYSPKVLEHINGLIRLLNKMSSLHDDLCCNISPPQDVTNAKICATAELEWAKNIVLCINNIHSAIPKSETAEWTTDLELINKILAKIESVYADLVGSLHIPSK